MNSLTLSSIRNRIGRRDGNEFKRESRAFHKYWREDDPGNVSTLVEYESKGAANKRNAVLHAIDCYDGPMLDVVAFFCHGTWNKLDGAFSVEHARHLAGALAPHCDCQIDVVLYACLCGKRSDGFAVALAKAFEDHEIDATVWGHQTAGHTTWNPMLDVCMSGGWLRNVARTWKERRKLRKWLKTGDNRFRIPAMFLEEIRQEALA
jgi:hypothetical protein